MFKYMPSILRVKIKGDRASYRRAVGGNSVLLSNVALSKPRILGKLATKASVDEFFYRCPIQRQPTVDVTTI